MYLHQLKPNIIKDCYKSTRSRKYHKRKCRYITIKCIHCGKKRTKSEAQHNASLKLFCSSMCGVTYRAINNIKIKRKKYKVNRIKKINFNKYLVKL